jgi:signal transduction histidine kinase
MTFLDITGRKRLEVQLRQAQKMEALGALAGGITHDFNNVLAAILGYTELALHNVSQDSNLWHYLQEVHTAGTRARNLVQTILGFSRQNTVEPQPVQLDSLVREVLTLLRSTLPSTIDMRQHLNQDAGLVLVNPTQIHQVMMNLCTNAEFAMRETGGVLEVSLEAVEVRADFAAVCPHLQPGPHVRLTVRDTGHGMTPKILEHIFDPFFTTKGIGEGTGMGLAAVHDIVASHSGAIVVISAPGQGTTFEIYLPRIGSTPDNALPLEEPIPRGRARVGVRRRGFNVLFFRPLRAFAPPIPTFPRQGGRSMARQP